MTEDVSADRQPMTGLEIARYLPPGFLDEALRADVLAGLTRSPKQLPPKWFYDSAGSELFEQITRLPEYYPTRAEREILRDRAGEIAAISRAHTLVELGSGSAEKTGLLLDALRAGGSLRRYVPVDVSEAALRAAGERVAVAYPGLAVQAVVSDFEEHLGLPPTAGRAACPRMVVFLGGTIGNLLPAQRADFLTSVRAELHPGDSLLLGTDLVKDPATLVAAYDDAEGVTAAFNKNVLSVINRELDGGFDLSAFAHVAVWDSSAEWIEMRLRSLTDQTVKIGALGLAVPFDEGEEMRTEVSAKFRVGGIRAELAAAGFEMRAWWTDAMGRFGLSLSVPVEP
jgi:L-histidine Nalpha-methyltransferase